MRCGLAAAIDSKVLDEAIGGGIHQIANGPFSPGQDGHLDDNGYPKYDPAKAAELIGQYTAEKGKPKIIYSTINDTNSLRDGRAHPAVLAGRRRRRRGAAGRAVEAHHQRPARRPRLQRLRLAQPRRPRRSTTRTSGGTSDNALPPGQLALNFGRLKDPVINDLLAKNRAEPDPAKRKAVRRGGQPGVRQGVLDPADHLHDLGHPGQGQRPGHRPGHLPGRHGQAARRRRLPRPGLVQQRLAEAVGGWL